MRTVIHMYTVYIYAYDIIIYCNIADAVACKIAKFRPNHVAKLRKCDTRISYTRTSFRGQQPIRANNYKENKRIRNVCIVKECLMIICVFFNV